MIQSCTRPLVALALLATACGNAPDHREWGGAVHDSGGITVVRNPEVGLWGERERWVLDELLRIGVSNGESSYQFGDIVDITIGATGELFVLDGLAAKVRVFSSEGVFLRAFGSAGSGPGQFSSGGVTALLHGRADTLLVMDMGNQRVVRFLENGATAGGYRVDFVDHGIPLQWAVLPDTTLAVQLHPFPRPDVDPATARDLIVTLDGRGAVQDTLLDIAVNPMFAMRNGRPTVIYFAPEPTWAIGAQGWIYYGVSNAYRVQYHRVDGQLIRIVGKESILASVEDADKRILLDAFSELMEQNGSRPEALAEFRARAEFADVFPAYKQLREGMDGTLWIQAVAPVRSMGIDAFRRQLDLGTAEWDVFNREGLFLGRVVMTDRFSPLRFREDRIYGVWRDEVDVPYLMVLRIRVPVTSA